MSFKYSIHSGEKRNFHAWDYVVFGAVLVVSAVIGIVVAIRDRKKNTTEEFLLGGRSMNPVFVAMSLLSTYVSALSILGIPGEVYAYNTMLLMWTIIVMFVSILGAAQIFLPTFYNLGVTSVFEVTEIYRLDDNRECSTRVKSGNNHVLIANDHGLLFAVAFRLQIVRRF